MNPIHLSREIERRYRQYLSTTFYFRDPELRASFEEALRSGRLTKGPFLEATPVFKRGQLTREVIHPLGLQPDEGFLRALHPRLFWHQEAAITRILSGHNVIVATGTGSGKTEIFLYPILLHLYEEFQRGSLCPGVRALILYPMNALANDQRERLGGICTQLQENGSPFQFKFGQYIGETPEDENDSRRNARDHMANRLPGELVLRREMRRSPPHILLTNYSMLEYLLLRPADSPLFDGGQARWWKFLVLDEAHQYRGSRGIEMAMLLRRLKERLRQGGRSEPFRCIATSATLLEGEADRADVARFASDLFGEPFQEEDVILGETEPLPEVGMGTLSSEDYRVLLQILNDEPATIPEELAQIAVELGVQLEDDRDVPRAIGSLLERDRRAIRLLKEISDKPREVQQIADQVVGDLEEQRVEALADLVTLLLRAKSPDSGAPLLSSRYHLFIRSLEGAFVAYHPSKRVFLDRKVEGRDGAAFEVALCRECGQHYFVGRVQGGKLVEAIRDPSHEDFGATFFRPIEDKDAAEIENTEASRSVLRLCLRCGAISKGDPNCGHPNVLTVVQGEAPRDQDRKDQLARCAACGYHAAGRDPVREVVHGTDGPNAVIATTLYRKLPEDRRKVLAFADGRQQAAFFAWYLENSYRDILSRNLIFRVGRELASYAPAGLSLRELATGLRDILKREQILPAATGDLELRREAWLWLYREFLTDEQRISLEGVGLVRWSIQWPDWFRPSQMLLAPPWSLSEQEAQDLLLILLDTMRTDRAVELRAENGVSLQWADLDLQATQMRFRIGRPQGARNVRSWDGKTTKRVRLLSRLLIQKGISEEKATDEAVDALRHLWDHLRECDEKAPSVDDRLLARVNDARRLNPDWWRLIVITFGDTLFQCDTCGRVQATSVQGVCPRYHCSGTLEPIAAESLESNHYRLLYQEQLPGILRVEEHTAQLDKEKAREFQREFQEDRIHVLSCSTTFELGVDLGNLDTIFLRNVPPEAFNYAQRVGRAGRRSGYPGIAITYCRRGPHDLYHFARPERMLSGKVRPPILSLRNEKIITRHIIAAALSDFFRVFPQRFKTVEDFFVDLQAPSAVRDFREFLHGRQDELERMLRDIIPQEMHARVGLDDSSWVEKIAGDDSRFAQAEDEVSDDYHKVQSLEQQAAKEGDYDTAKWARARALTIAREDVLSFLSRKAVIPKYGFPVDVVELDTQRAYQGSDASEVLLQRDLSIAIAEFAPTSKLVANKRLWVSHGLKRVAEREWPQRSYKRCVRHNVFLQWKKGEPEPPMRCGCNLHPRKYIIPRFGFITNRDKPREPRFRPPKIFTTRPYFAGLTSGEPDIVSMPSSAPAVTMKRASPGLMVVLCEGRLGRGFYICNSCGSGFGSPQYPHKGPYGSECRGTLMPGVSLGHEFPTDVLQLQFHQKPVGGLEPTWFGFSLAYALVEGAADVLEVPSTDLSATIAYDERYDVPPIILYDNVPGGAGLVARLESEKTFRRCLESALERVKGDCGCDDDASCYGCLRSYRNQFAHQYLQRGPIKHYLEELIGKWE